MAPIYFVLFTKDILTPQGRKLLSETLARASSASNDDRSSRYCERGLLWRSRCRHGEREKHMCKLLSQLHAATTYGGRAEERGEKTRLGPGDAAADGETD